jgi:glycosyltransferase involved in cell wall biosynthesis
MMEHLFDPNAIWQSKCHQFYISRHPLFSISQWNIEALRTQFNRTSETIYIGNGVNLQDFPISRKPKDGKTVLIEGWEAGNPTKDVKHLGAMVAKKLKQMGYTVIAYGGIPIKTLRNVPHEYHCRPDLATLNSLYERATILIKASRCDARSCSPMEAMTKGTVTVRAIEKGDDDLIFGVNSIRTTYHYKPFLQACIELLSNEKERIALAENCYLHLERYGWDYWMQIINQRICN